MRILSRPAAFAFIALAATLLTTPSFASFGAPVHTGGPVQSGSTDGTRVIDLSGDRLPQAEIVRISTAAAQAQPAGSPPVAVGAQGARL